ncbi:hypothetical protein [Streptomyces sp. LMG1-1-1.1]|uniref:hypothetical protein n=1 Tax=Streptomyces sp. LMG1-1-1.1 TaxID=3135245 RepID=UPI00346646B3
MRFRRHHLGRVLAAIGLTAGSLAFTAAGPAAADVVEPFGERYGDSLYGDFTTIGNTVMGCPTAPADLAARCATAASGQGADDDSTFVMRRVDAAGLAAGTPPGHGSSTGHVVVPAGAEVAYARLFWGGNDGTYKGPSGALLKRCDVSGADVAPSPGDPATTAPVIKVGARAALPVSIDSMVVDPSDTGGPHYYTGESDVTAAFKGVSGTDARIAVGGVWAPNGKGCVAGWSLTVVHRFPAPDPVHAPERRSVHVYGGHVLQRSTSPATTITVDGFHRGPGTVRASVTAYEGDRNTPGDRFLVDGKNVTEPSTGDTDNFFVGGNDGAVSPKPTGDLGIDAKAFDVPAGAVPPGATSADLTFSTKGDTYVPSALAFSAPVPDLEIAKIKNPPAGDGRLRDAVEVEPPRSPCGDGSEDPTCAAAPVLDLPEPGASSKPTPSDPPPSPTPPEPTASGAPSSPAPVPSTTAPVRPAPPAPGPQGGRSSSGSMAETGGNGERLWLLGALAVALAATGLVAKAALRGSRRD